MTDVQEDVYPKVYYRYYDRLTQAGYWNSDSSIYHSPKIKIVLEEYQVVRKTPKGAWIARWSGSNPHTFILDSSSKKVAFPTIIAARTDYIRRKKNQNIIHEERAARAKHCLWMAAREWDLEPVIQRPSSLTDIYGKAAVYGPNEYDINEEFPL